MLITDLGQLASLRIVERSRLNDVLGELKLGKGSFIDPKTAQKLGRGLAAQYLLGGAYALAGDTLRIDARLIRVETGEVVASQRASGKKDEFFALEKELVDGLVDALHLKLAPAERSKLRVNPTQSFEAWSTYSAGLEAADGGDAERARSLFEKALKADPNYRAARTASERLAAIFGHTHRETLESADETLRTLDPKAKDFASRVEGLLASLDSTRADQLRRKLELLSFLGERDLIACSQAGGPATGNPTVLVGGVPSGGAVSHCRQAQEVLQIAYRLVEDPSQWEVIPKVCERFIHRLPNDKALLGYCESSLVRPLEAKRKEGKEEAQRSLEEDRAWVLKATGPDDWRRALLENDAQMKAVLQRYAGK
jgi:TolB-like protein